VDDVTPGGATRSFAVVAQSGGIVDIYAKRRVNHRSTNNGTTGPPRTRIADDSRLWISWCESRRTRARNSTRPRGRRALASVTARRRGGYSKNVRVGQAGSAVDHSQHANPQTTGDPRSSETTYSATSNTTHLTVFAGNIRRTPIARRVRNRPGNDVHHLVAAHPRSLGTTGDCVDT